VELCICSKKTPTRKTKIFWGDAEVICKDDDVCPSCLLRRRKECGYEPFGFGPDMDGEYGVGCSGMINQVTINDAYFMDGLEEYHGIGEVIPWSFLYPIMIWAGMNWLEDSIAHQYDFA
jgi:hypothetical protein